MYYYYTVGYDYWESQDIITLISSKRYEEEEFNELCTEIIKDLYFKYKNKKSIKLSKASFGEEVEFFARDRDDHGLWARPENFTNGLIESLVKTHGFEELKTTQNFIFWNGDRIDTPPSSQASQANEVTYQKILKEHESRIR
jgi:hypothetical protein